MRDGTKVLEIQEYGKVVRVYNDLDYDRFMKVSQELIANHLNTFSKQKADEIKNITIRLYTY